MMAIAPRWQFAPAPKYAPTGVVRTIPPRQTIARVTPLLDRMGVTRVADVTGLDRVGIPNYTTVRPRERDEGISYYNGKGLTRHAAHAGALMEAVERYSGEFCDLPVQRCTRSELAAPSIDPDQIIVPRSAPYTPSTPLEWVAGFELIAGQPIYVPLNAVVCPYEPPPGQPAIYFAHTNGLASGNTLEEAVCHALCEVIERDASALADAALDLAPAVDDVLASIGARPADAAGRAVEFPLLDLETLPPRQLTLVRRLQRAGLEVYVRDKTSSLGIPTLDCAIVERRLDDRHLVHGGCGTHPDARVAVTRALTEAAQSRVGHIQGGREDLPKIIPTPMPFDPDDLYGRGEHRPFDALPSYTHTDIRDDIRLMLGRLERAGLSQVVAVDLTRPELGLPVVRIIIPGAETWSVFFTHVRRATFGRRVAEVLHGHHAV